MPFALSFSLSSSVQPKYHGRNANGAVKWALSRRDLALRTAAAAVASRANNLPSFFLSFSASVATTVDTTRARVPLPVMNESDDKLIDKFRSDEAHTVVWCACGDSFSGGRGSIFWTVRKWLPSAHCWMVVPLVDSLHHS